MEVSLCEQSPLRDKLKGLCAVGFCISSARLNDGYLRHLADNLSLTVVTVDYRKVPEDPFPAPLDDAIDAALTMISRESKERS